MPNLVTLRPERLAAQAGDRVRIARPGGGAPLVGAVTWCDGRSLIFWRESSGSFPERLPVARVMAIIEKRKKRVTR